jgi:purine-nucleoside phosphorylase
MTEQKKRILESADYIRSCSPFKEKVTNALVTYYDPSFLKGFNIIKRIKYADIPPKFHGAIDAAGEFIFAETKKGKKKLVILNGHVNFYNGFSMRDSAHPVYVLKELGIRKLVIVDEVGHLNPRFIVGGVSLIYDHINLMGDNPLIGENDNSIGTRFPDMSNPYDEKQYYEIEKYLRDIKFVFYPSVYLGVTGPETETEAECRFYREIGADVLGYSLVPENMAVIHGGMSCAAFGMISRELVADRLVEISNEEKLKNRLRAEKAFAPVIEELFTMLK